MNTAICDDEKVWQERLIKLLDKYAIERHIEIRKKCFSSGELLFKSDEVFDVIFMDYQMAGLDGIETARKIRQRNPESFTIFVSSFPQVALDAFEVRAYRFLTKPIDEKKLFKAIDDYRTEIDKEKFLVFKMHDRTLRVRISDIIYLEAAKNHTKIHTAREDYEVLTNIKEVNKILPQEKFYRCHKAFIVSFAHIKSHTKTDAYFDDGSSAYISRNYIAAFRAAFQEYILKYNSGDIS